MSVPLQEDKQLRIATARAQDGNPSAVPEALCPLIDTLGTPEFGQHLFVCVERMLSANAAAVCAFGGCARGTRMIMGDWSGGTDLSDATIQRHTSEYAERYAADDPARLALARTPGSVVTTCQSRAELPHAGHRALLEEAGFRERVVALFPAGAGGWYSLNVLRRSGRVTEALFQRFARAAPVYGSLVARHLRMEPLTRLLQRSPLLTGREASVCCGLLRGRTARQIADELGIELTSVHTYRKRAYRKLGVRSLRDLFLLLL